MSRPEAGLGGRPAVPGADDAAGVLCVCVCASACVCAVCVFVCFVCVPLHVCVLRLCVVCCVCVCLCVVVCMYDRKTPQPPMSHCCGTFFVVRPDSSRIVGLLFSDVRPDCPGVRQSGRENARLFRCLCLRCRLLKAFLKAFLNAVLQPHVVHGADPGRGATPHKHGLQPDAMALITSDL